MQTITIMLLRFILFVAFNIIGINFCVAQHYSIIKPTVQSASKHVGELVRVYGVAGKVTEKDSTLCYFEVSISKKNSLTVVVYGAGAVESALRISNSNMFWGPVKRFKKKPAIFMSSEYLKRRWQIVESWKGDPSRDGEN